MTDPTRLIANNLFDLIQEALTHCTPTQARLFRLVYGITDNGIDEPMDVSDAANTLGLARTNTYITLARARAAVFEHVAARQVEQMRTRLQVWFDVDEEEPVPQVEPGLRVKRHGRTSTMPGSITLGEGSEAHAMVERRRSAGPYRKQARIDAHRKYASEGGDA
jgi:hypothetical protein